jgi:hypothetical protein
LRNGLVRAIVPSAPDVFDELFLQFGPKWDDVIEVITPQYESVFVPNKSATLILLCTWEHTDIVEHLKSSVRIDAYGFVIGLDPAQGYMYAGGANLDCHSRVQGSYSGFEWNERLVLVRKDSEETVLDTKADTSRQGILPGQKPIVALGILINVMYESVERIVITVGDGDR